jgi:hypothetical protein
MARILLNFSRQKDKIDRGRYVGAKRERAGPIETDAMEEGKR